jgi:hypothetical protein
VAALVVVSGFAAVPGPRSDALPQSAAGGEAADYLTDGPVRQMRQGPYTWSVDYASAADAKTVVGKWELVQAARDAVVAAGELHGTDGAERTEEIPVPFFSLQPKEFVLRVATYGLAPMQVIQTGVRHG